MHVRGFFDIFGDLSTICKTKNTGVIRWYNKARLDHLNFDNLNPILLSVDTREGKLS